jgi:transketolase
MKKIQGFTWTVDDVNLISSTETWGDVLVECATLDPRIVGLSADLAQSTKMRRFKETFPERYFNVGIAEQNLMAAAAGLAATDLTPVVCTYATFAALRAFEFVRTDIGYAKRNVKIIGTLAGVAFGQGGPTHHSMEDLALMRTIPGMTVLAPADGTQMGEALRAALAHPGPVYLRTGRAVEVPLPESHLPFTMGQATTVKEGRHATVLACGPCVQEALKAAQQLTPMGLNIRVLNMASIKPLDTTAVLKAMAETGHLVSVEDHSIIGGLGSAVAEVITQSGQACSFTRLGHQDTYLPMGVPEDLMHLGGFDADAIVKALCTQLGQPIPTQPDWHDKF